MRLTNLTYRFLKFNIPLHRLPKYLENISQIATVEIAAAHVQVTCHRDATAAGVTQISGPYLVLDKDTRGGNRKPHWGLSEKSTLEDTSAPIYDLEDIFTKVSAISR